MATLFQFYIYGGFFIMTFMTIIFFILVVCLFKLSKTVLKNKVVLETHHLLNVVNKGRYSILIIMLAGTVFCSSYLLRRWAAPPPEGIVILEPIGFYINVSASITGILFFTILTVWMDVLKFISIAKSK